MKTQKRAAGDTLKSSNYIYVLYVLYVPLADALVGQAARSLVPVAEKTAGRRRRASVSTTRNAGRRNVNQY